MNREPIGVAVALIERDRRWLVACRQADAHLGGYWEFPGGKIEPAETAAAAAIREAQEECGVHIEVRRVLPTLTAEYPDRLIALTPVLASWVAGEARPLAGTDVRWVTFAELQTLRMPAINARIISLLDETQRE